MHAHLILSQYMIYSDSTIAVSKSTYRTVRIILSESVLHAEYGIQRRVYFLGIGESQANRVMKFDIAVQSIFLELPDAQQGVISQLYLK